MALKLQARLYLTNATATNPGELHVESSATFATIRLPSLIIEITCTKHQLQTAIRINVFAYELGFYPAPIGQAILRPSMGNEFPVLAPQGETVGRIVIDSLPLSESKLVAATVMPPIRMFDETLYQNTSTSHRLPFSEKAGRSLRAFVKQHGTEVPLAVLFANLQWIYAEEKIRIVDQSDVHTLLSVAYKLVDPRNRVEVLNIVFQLLLNRIVYTKDKRVYIDDQGTIRRTECDLWRNSLFPFNGVNPLSPFPFTGDCEDIAMAGMSVFVELQQQFMEELPAARYYCPFAVDCSLVDTKDSHIMIVLISWHCLLTRLLDPKIKLYKKLFEWAQTTDLLTWEEHPIIIVEPNELSGLLNISITAEKAVAQKELHRVVYTEATRSNTAGLVVPIVQPTVEELDSYCEALVSFWSPTLFSSFGIGGLTLVSRTTSVAGSPISALAKKPDNFWLIPKHTEELKVDNVKEPFVFLFGTPSKLRRNASGGRHTTEELKKAEEIGVQLAEERKKEQRATMVLIYQMGIGFFTSAEDSWSLVHRCWPKLRRIQTVTFSNCGIQYAAYVVKLEM